jgi:prephenate dehydrogenase
MARELRRLAIVGTGLIGASIGLAAKRAGVQSVTGYDVDDESLAVARERGAVDVTAPSLEQAVAQAELAVVATPVATLPAEVQGTLEASDGRCTVTDVGSTKRAVCSSVGDRARFIGGHPVCGSEAQGPRYASGDLFGGATWFLTPVAETDPERYRRLHGFVASLGAVPVAVDPHAHDRLVALTSHVPHALANVLLNHAGSFRVDGHEPLAAAGASLRDMTRVAGANPRIWVDIFLDNADELGRALAEHRRRIGELERALAERDAGYLARWIGEAAGNRRRLLAEAYPDPGSLQRLRVHVPDRPGVLSGLTQALGAEHINIEDFELHHLSPERGGTLSVLVAGEEEARRAAELLEAQGYSVITTPAVEGPS